MGYGPSVAMVPGTGIIIRKCFYVLQYCTSSMVRLSPPSNCHNRDCRRHLLDSRCRQHTPRFINVLYYLVVNCTVRRTYDSTTVYRNGFFGNYIYFILELLRTSESRHVCAVSPTARFGLTTRTARKRFRKISFSSISFTNSRVRST